MQKHRSSEEPGSVLRLDHFGRHPQTSPQRERIVDAIVESCAAEKTYAATTISDVVARFHIFRTTFYKHFDDKRACFDAALDHCLDRAAGGLPPTPTPTPRAPAVAARKAATAVLETLAARPGPRPAGDRRRDRATAQRWVERYRQATDPRPRSPFGRRNGRHPTQAHTDARLAFGQAQVLILNQIAVGKADRLPELRGRSSTSP